MESLRSSPPRLFYFPGTCALASHIVLEEIGKPFELSLVDLVAGEQNNGPYAELNPKHKIPALIREDGTLLTESPAICWYLARCNPTVDLLPTDAAGEARVLELFDYMVATVHMRGFTRVFRPLAFSPADEDAAISAGLSIVSQGLALLSEALGGKDYLLDNYSIADAALCYLEFWALVRTTLEIPSNLVAHYERMRTRPAVSRAMDTEKRDLDGFLSRGLLSENPTVQNTCRRLLDTQASALALHGWKHY